MTLKQLKLIHLLLIRSTFIKYNMFEETIDSQSFITIMRIKSWFYESFFHERKTKNQTYDSNILLIPFLQ